MHNSTLQITKWPFYLANFILNLVAVLLVVCASSFSVGVAFLFVLSAGLGATLLALPFLFEYRARVQAYAIEMRSKASVNEKRFEEWARDLKEQTEYLSQLTEQIENNMYATEGMVRRADRKLMALEKFESKMDQVLGGVSSGELSSTGREYSSLRSVENEPLFSQSASLAEGKSDIELSLFNGGRDDFDGVLKGDDSDVDGEGNISAMKVLYAEDSDAEATLGFKDEEDQNFEEESTEEFFANGLDGESNDSLALESEEQDMQESAEDDVSVTPKVRVSTKSGGRKKKSATKQVEEMSLFPEENASRDDVNDVGNTSSGYKDEAASIGEEAPESAYTVMKSDSGKTMVVANVMIGLGNKPFIRGSGSSLNWGKGVAMEFLEIGKWGYTFEESESMIEFRIFKNDKEADAYVYQLNEGQILEVSPKFAVKEMSKV